MRPPSVSRARARPVGGAHPARPGDRTGLWLLGAWGCGAFGNDRERTARDFKTVPGEQGGAFAEVILEISDWSPERRHVPPFRDPLAGDSERGDGKDGSS